jgi:hypothetical protein
MKLTEKQLLTIDQLIEDTPIRVQQDVDGYSDNIEGTLSDAAERVREYLTTLDEEVVDAN